MRIQTGQGTIPLMTLIAIWSISAITSLPGLAVSPILGDLDKIFPHVSDLEIQMLTSLPSLLIIPFVLLSGKLSESKDKTTILMIGLAIFLASGILYFFANSMLELILISCLLGVGAGMVIPLSTGLIADFFVGEYRTKQLGFSSSITNLTLVLATFLTGWLANYNWHYPFVVYLI
ncbi:MAG: MFS transporter, partial [Tannerellaceae bacterium]